MRPAAAGSGVEFRRPMAPPSIARRAAPPPGAPRGLAHPTRLAPAVAPRATMYARTPSSLHNAALLGKLTSAPESSGSVSSSPSSSSVHNVQRDSHIISELNPMSRSTKASSSSTTQRSVAQEEPRAPSRGEMPLPPPLPTSPNRGRAGHARRSRNKNANGMINAGNKRVGRINVASLDFTYDDAVSILKKFGQTRILSFELYSNNTACFFEAAPETVNRICSSLQKSEQFVHGKSVNATVYDRPYTNDQGTVPSRVLYLWGLPEHIPNAEIETIAKPFGKAVRVASVGHKHKILEVNSLATAKSIIERQKSAWTVLGGRRAQISYSPQGIPAPAPTAASSRLPSATKDARAVGVFKIASNKFTHKDADAILSKFGQGRILSFALSADITSCFFEADSETVHRISESLGSNRQYMYGRAVKAVLWNKPFTNHHNHAPSRVLYLWGLPAQNLPDSMFEAIAKPFGKILSITTVGQRHKLLEVDSLATAKSILERQKSKWTFLGDRRVQISYAPPSMITSPAAAPQHVGDTTTPVSPSAAVKKTVEQSPPPSQPQPQPPPPVAASINGADNSPSQHHAASRNSTPEKGVNGEQVTPMQQQQHHPSPAYQPLPVPRQQSLPSSVPMPPPLLQRRLSPAIAASTAHRANQQTIALEQHTLFLKEVKQAIEGAKVRFMLHAVV